MRIVVTHHNADLDALASLIAASRLYDATPVGGTLLSPPVKRFLALHKDHFPILQIGEVDTEIVSTMVVVDVRDRRRLKEFDDLFDRAQFTVAYDHHPDGDHDIVTDESLVEPVGACITLLVERLIEDGIEIPAADATLYLLGLYSDTGRLSFATTQPRDVDVAGELLRRGANLKVVNRYLRRQYTAEQGDLLISFMANSEEISVDSVEVAFCHAVVPRFVRGAATVVQQVLELGGHDAIFGVIEFEKNKRVQIIARSRISYLNVGAIMQEYGGGGHHGAAAATLKKRRVHEVIEELKVKLQQVEMEPTRVSEIMSSPVAFVEHTTELSEVRTFLKERGFSGAPVLKNGTLVGVISRRDVARAARTEKLHLPVSSHMTHEVASVDFMEPVEDTLDIMTARDIGRLPVTKDGEIIGIVTRTDLLGTLYMAPRDDTEAVLA